MSAIHKVASTPSISIHFLVLNARTVATRKIRFRTSGIANQATLNVARLSTGLSSQYSPTLRIANTPATSGTAHFGWIRILGFLRAANQKTATNTTRRIAILIRIQVMGRACHEGGARAWSAEGGQEQ